MNNFNTLFRRFSVCALGILLLSGVFTSCNKEPLTVTYAQKAILEYTLPDQATYPETRKAYVSLLNDFQDELGQLDLNHVRGIEMRRGELNGYDEREGAGYDRSLPGLKDLLAKYQAKFDDLEARDKAPFSLKLYYILMRGDKTFSDLLRSNVFELKYD